MEMEKNSLIKYLSYRKKCQEGEIETSQQLSYSSRE